MITKFIDIKTVKLSNYLIIISILLLGFFMIILSLILYYDTKAEIKYQNQQSGIVEFNQYSEYIDGSFQMIEKLINYLQNDTSFHKLLNTNSNNIVEKINKKTSVENHLTNVVKNNDVIDSINLISNQESYNSGSYLFGDELINELKNESILKNYFFKIPTEDAQYINKTESLVNDLNNYSYVEFSFSSDSSINWNVFILLNHRFLFRDSEDSTNIAFLSAKDILYKGSALNLFKNEYFYTLNNKIDNSNKQEVHNLNLYSKKLPVNDLTAIYAVDATKYIHKLNVIRWWNLFICIISLMISFGVSKLVSKRITKPLKALTDKLNTYQLGTPDMLIKEDKKKINIKTKLLFYFVLTIIIPMSIYMNLFYIQSGNIIRSMIADSSKTIFHKISTQINRTVANKIEIIQMLSFDETIQNFFVFQGNYKLEDIDNIIENMRHFGLERDSVSFYSKYYKKLYSDRQTKMQNDVFGRFETIKRGVVCSYDTDAIGDEFLSFSIPVVSMLRGNLWGTKIGYCKIDSELYRYKDMLKPIEDFGGIAAITDQNTKPLIHTKNFDLNTNMPLILRDNYTQVIENGDFINYYNLISGTGLFVAAQFNLNEIMHTSRPYVQTYIYLLLVFTLVILIISYLLIINITKLIERLNKKIITYDLNGGNLPDKNTNKKFSIDEIDCLNDSFVKMSERIETLVDDLIIANNENNMIAIERKNAEMIALQAQINPHFLYNTLNNLIALIRSGNYDEAVSATKLLGSLFKYGISREDIIIPIREELEYAKVYTQLIKIRFEDRVNFLWDIEDSVYKYTTIKLILQPLIENSIHHGFSVDRNKGTVSIKCRETDNDIIFEVSDNGQGISPEILAEIKETLKSNNYGNRVGIFNVQGRLKLNYGDSSKLEIISDLGHGTIVSIRIPKVI